LEGIINKREGESDKKLFKAIKTGKRVSAPPFPNKTLK
jgi:hypothetical protein